MRRVAAFAFLVAVAAACANIGAPPGGPTRTEPPTIESVTPESGSVNVRAERVTFRFDAVVSDRPAGNAPSLEALFVISPRDGAPRVAWERSRIEVRPRRGFQPNTAYTVTMLPGISDLRGNVIREPRTTVFSTGPTMPPFAIRGRVFDWMAERPAPGAVIEAIRLPDSVTYVAAADSMGQFSLGPLDSGAYSVRAFVDANRNSALEPTETWDSVSVRVREVSPTIELLTAPRDTAGPRLLTASASDSVTIVLNFDKPLDPAALLTPASFRVLGADSARLGIARVNLRRPAPDSVPLRPDSVQPPPPPPLPVRPPALPTAGPRQAMPRPSVAAPTQWVTLILDAANPLQPGASYRVSVVNARGLLGAVRSSERVITVDAREPEAPRRP